MTRFELIRWGPYRLFFPLGIMAALVGVGHWLFWSLGWIPESNGYFHAMIQVQGFLALFVVGFLMTALPRFLGTDPASAWEVLGSLALALTLLTGLWIRHWYSAEIAFLLLLFFTAVFAGRRLPKRTKSPPASFLLIGFGFVHAVVGSVLMMASHFGETSFGAMEIGRQMVQIGFLTCLVLGIAGYLAPFLMGYAADPSCDPGVTPMRGRDWRAHTFHALTGTALVVSFLTEVRYPRTSQAVRGAFALTHLLCFGQIWRPVQKKLVYVYFFWIACWLVALGSIAVPLWPDFKLASLHVLFIGGFSLMIFSFALVVILSHGADAAKLQGKLIPLWIVGVAVILAMGFRVVADIDAWRYKIWIHSAAGTWVVAAGLWLIYIFPKLWRVPALDVSGRPTSSYAKKPS